jgi:hypothetical protein
MFWLHVPAQPPKKKEQDSGTSTAGRSAIVGMPAAVGGSWAPVVVETVLIRQKTKTGLQKSLSFFI